MSVFVRSNLRIHLKTNEDRQLVHMELVSQVQIPYLIAKLCLESAVSGISSLPGVVGKAFGRSPSRFCVTFFLN